MQNYIQSLQQLHLKLENIACWTIRTRVSRNLENWVVWGQILPLICYRSAWSCLVLVRNDQKKNFQTQGVPATGDWACAPWLQQHSVNTFFWNTLIDPKMCIRTNVGMKERGFTRSNSCDKYHFAHCRFSEHCQNKTPTKTKPQWEIFSYKYQHGFLPPWPWRMPCFSLIGGLTRNTIQKWLAILPKPGIDHLNLVQYFKVLKKQYQPKTSKHNGSISYWVSRIYEYHQSQRGKISFAILYMKQQL